MKILITGGHVTPALAVIEELRKRKGIEIVFVGRQYTPDTELTLSYEYTQLEKLGIPFIHLTTGKLTRSFSLAIFIDIVKVFIGLLQSRAIIKEQKPDSILTFGGYIGLPIAVMGYLSRIPVYVHEQTISPGLSNRIIARLARKVFISFPETKKKFPMNKTLLTGNPIRTDILTQKDAPFNITSNKPIIFVMGGSLGSHSINIHIEKILEELVKDFTVIHQTGNITRYNDYERLSKIDMKNYYARPHIFQNEIGWVYRHADLVVSRAGANTIFELIHLRKPSVLIPLPWSAGGEQEKHADFMAQAGVAEEFDQEHESGELLALIKKVSGKKQLYAKNFANLKNIVHENSAKQIVDAINI